MIIFILLFSISISFTQFKNDRQINIESKILAPCCYNGIILEHNSDVSKLISSIIKNIINENFNKDKILLQLDKLILLSNIKISNKIKTKIYNNIYQGISDENIINIFISIFGEKIIAIPLNNIFGKITWLMPSILLILSISILLIRINNLYSQPKNTINKISIKETKNIEKMINKYKNINK